jgi:hypothetical protein
LWTRYVNDIVKIVKRLAKEDEKRDIEINEAIFPPRLGSQPPIILNDTDALQELTNQVREVRDIRVRNAQSTFDQALSRFQRRE